MVQIRKQTADDPGQMTATLRPDLQFSRVMFGDEPSYVVRDPLTGEAQRLDLREYRVLCSLDGKADLNTAFARCVARDLVDEDEKEDFLRFMASMQGVGIVSMPFDDGAMRRRRIADRAERKRKARGPVSFLFAQFPLGSPDRILERFMPMVRPLFTRAAFVAWLLLMVAALGVLVARWGDFTSPLLDVVSLDKLPALVVLMVVLKVVHEFGHGFACKHFGGHVPEMGVMMIVVAPLAYVDANAAWSFPERRQRLIVSLAGMYVETFCAALGVFIWAATAPGVVNSVAYQSIVLASVTTILFNLNPLMRFDGYHLLTDLVQIPNLRQRAKEELGAAFDHTVLGMPRADSMFRPKVRRRLAVFGLACVIYRITLVLSICATIATELAFVGLGLAAVYVVNLLITAVRSWGRHLVFDPATSGVRRRALAVAALVFVVLPVGGAAIPIPGSIGADGVVTSADERLVRARVPGIVRAVVPARGQPVATSDLLARLENGDLVDLADNASAELAFASMERGTAELVDLPQAERLQARERLVRRRAERAEEDRAALECRSPVSGRLVGGLGSDALGSFLAVGDQIARIRCGEPRVRFVVAEEDLGEGVPSPGDKVVCWSSAEPMRRLDGRVASVAETGTRAVRDPALTNLGGGRVVVDPMTGEAAFALFEIEVSLDRDTDVELLEGLRVHGRFHGASRTLLERIHRRVMRFAHAIRAM